MVRTVTYIRTEEHRKKMSLLKKGKKRPDGVLAKANMARIAMYKSGKLKGKPCSLETKNKIRQANKGKRTRLGAILSDETKQRISISVSEYFKRIGVKPRIYPVEWTNTLKRAIRERDNYICQLCSQYALDVHHIDYNVKNCSVDNLITLCRSCHAKTNYDRENWRNRFGN